MKYKSFYINNFKGVNELNISLENIPNSEIITLVGINESGKTTILNALETFFIDKPLEGAYEFIPKAKQFNFTGEITIQSTLIFEDKDKDAIKNIINKNGLIFIKICDEVLISKKYIFNNSRAENLAKIVDVDITIKRNSRCKSQILAKTATGYKEIESYILDAIPKIIYYRHFLFDFPSRIYLEPGKEKSDDKINSTYINVLQDVLDSISSETSSGPIDIQNQIVQRIRSTTPADRESLNQIITRIGEKITLVVFEAWGKIFAPTNKEIILSSSIDGIADECYVDIRLKQGSQSYQISERSLGFKWFFTFLLFTEFRKNRNEDKGQTLFLLDEPASNLHSTAQSKLLQTFENLSGDKCRLVYTTHSHHMINPKWLSGAYIVINDALSFDPQNLDYNTDQTNISTEIYKKYVSRNTKQQSYFQPILDALEYQPSKLEDVPNIIILEGKYDFYILNYINDVILKKQYDLHFYPGMGADGDEGVIRLYCAWGRDFAVLRDAEKGGKSAKARYLSVLGNIIDGRIFTYEDIDKSLDGSSSEDLFSETERIEIIKTLFPNETSYSKSKFNSAIQQLYIDGTHFELSADTMGKFIKIFDFLKAN